MHRQIAGTFFSKSILPDRFGATFVDLHVHCTARVYVGGQIDLRELRLEKTRRRGNVMFGNSMMEFKNQCINEQKVLLENTKKKRIFDEHEFLTSFLFFFHSRVNEPSDIKEANWVIPSLQDSEGIVKGCSLDT